MCKYAFIRHKNWYKSSHDRSNFEQPQKPWFRRGWNHVFWTIESIEWWSLSLGGRDYLLFYPSKTWLRWVCFIYSAKIWCKPINPSTIHGNINSKEQSSLIWYHPHCMIPNMWFHPLHPACFLGFYGVVSFYWRMGVYLHELLLAWISWLIPPLMVAWWDDLPWYSLY